MNKSLCFGGHFELLIRAQSASARSGTEITEIALPRLNRQTLSQIKSSAQNFQPQHSQT